MATDENVLKRKRSRPSEWWATAPVSPPQHEAAPAPPKEAPKAAETQKRSSIPVETAAGALKDVLRRERSKPSEWWAAGATSSPVVQKKTPAPNPSRRRPVQANASLKVAPEIQAMELQDILKRKRSRPSDWWAASPSTPSQATLAKKDGRDSKTGAPRGIAKPAPLAENTGKSNSVLVLSKGDTAKKSMNGKVAVKELEVEIQQSGAPEDSNMPNRRGRPPSQKKPQEHESSSERQSRSGQPPNSNSEVQSVVLNRSSKTAGKQKSNENSTSQPTEESSVERSRRSSGGDKSARPDLPTDSQQEKGRRRTRRSDSHIQQSSIIEPRVEQPVRRRNTRMSELQIVVETASSAFGRSRAPSKAVRPVVVGRAAKPGKSGKGNPTIAHTKSTAKPSKSVLVNRKKPDPTPQVETVARKRKSLVNTKEGRRDAKRRKIGEVDHEDLVEDEADEIAPHQHLAPVTRKVSRHTIEEKWQPLPQSCIEHIERVLLDIQRPVVIHLKDENKRTQASTALQMVSRRLLSKISKGLPFPASTTRQREDEFDFEKILDRKRVLESHLTSARDGNKLLDDSLSKELALLESESAALAELEVNAKSEAVIMKQAERKLHPLVHSGEETGLDGLAILDLKIVPHFSVLDVTKDVELQHIAQDLEGHMDSLHGNVHQIEGIIEAVTQTKAAIQTTLFYHLNETQYEEVILGSD